MPLALVIAALAIAVVGLTTVTAIAWIGWSRGEQQIARLKAELDAKARRP